MALTGNNRHPLISTLQHHAAVQHHAVAVCAAAVLLLTAAACQREELDATAPGGTTGVATLVSPVIDVVQPTTADATVSADTRSVVTGTSLAQNGRTYGMFVCKHEDGTPSRFERYNSLGLYTNIQAYYSGGWQYSYASSSSAYFTPLTLFVDDPLDIYAYAPWSYMATLTGGYEYNITALAYSDYPDLMWASYEEGVDDATPTNRNLCIGAVTELTPKFHFHHALARIALHFKLANTLATAGYDSPHAMRLYQIDLNRADAAQTPLYTQGTMDLITGVVTPKGFSQSTQTVTCATGSSSGTDSWDITSSTSWSTYSFLVTPTTYLADDDFSFKFRFNGSGNAQQVIQSYSIQRSDLQHADDTYGFQPGYTYHFYFVIDNYIHLQNVAIDREWTNADEQNYNI